MNASLRDVDNDHETVSPVEFTSLLDLFRRMTLREWWRRVRFGLHADKSSGEYHWARSQVVRLNAPIAAIAVPLLVVLWLLFLGTIAPPENIMTVTLVEPKVVDKLEPIPPPPPERPLPPDPAEDPSMTTAGTDSKVPTPGTDEAFSPVPTVLDTVAHVRSPIALAGFMPSRNPGERGDALAQFGGTKGTEHAVYRTLRWLKYYQNPDGSWDASTGGSTGTEPAAAMTGLGLLTFLAHGETPASEEFGPTVEKAMKWLISAQDGEGRFSPRDSHNYTHPICAYALSEAFAMTRVPVIKYAAEKAVAIIVQGQNASGGWDYNMRPSQRDDLSVSAWCIQALKAAKLAELEVAGLDATMRKALVGIRKHQNATGRFGYTQAGDGTGGLTGAGVLSLQFMGAANDPAAHRGLQYLNSWTCNWNGSGMSNPIYYWYYSTQATFHAQGATWDAWNAKFKPTLIKNQIVVKDLYQWKGKALEMGYWNPASGKEFARSYAYNTTLCSLMLQVYYRHLLTDQKQAQDIAADADSHNALTNDRDDIEITVTM